MMLTPNKIGVSIMSAGFCYAILFTSGVLKVGRTSDIHGRLKSHVDSAKAIGGGVSKIFFSYQIDDFQFRESALIAMASKLGSVFNGREYFSGIKISQVRELMAMTVGPYVECDSVSKGQAAGSLTVSVNPYIISMSNRGAKPKRGVRERIKAVLEKLGPSSAAVVANRVKSISGLAMIDELESMVADEILGRDTIRHSRNMTSCNKYFLLGSE